MKLYITPGSAYARMARVVVIEKGLEDRVRIELARTRVHDSPYYRINPSGRVPYLVDDAGIGIEDSALICAYLDHLERRPSLELATMNATWEARRLEVCARSMLDGLAVWNREILRPTSEQSPGVIAHEAARSTRLVDAWEAQATHPLLTGPLNMLQITLGCALGLEERIPKFRWRAARPMLAAWCDGLHARPSFERTRPPQP